MARRAKRVLAAIEKKLMRALWLGGYDRGLRLTVDGETLEGASTGYLRVGPGECTPLSAEVLVDASAPPDVWRNALVSFETIVEPLERKA